MGEIRRLVTLKIKREVHYFYVCVLLPLFHRIPSLSEHAFDIKMKNRY